MDEAARHDAWVAMLCHAAEDGEGFVAAYRRVDPRVPWEVAWLASALLQRLDREAA